MVGDRVSQLVRQGRRKDIPHMDERLEHNTVIRPGYTEHAPPPDLAGYVNCFWTSLSDEVSLSGAPTEYRVLPDGCVDIVIGFGRAVPIANAATNDVTEAMGVGSMTRPLLITGDRARL